MADNPDQMDTNQKYNCKQPYKNLCSKKPNWSICSYKTKKWQPEQTYSWIWIQCCIWVKSIWYVQKYLLGSYSDWVSYFITWHGLLQQTLALKRHWFRNIVKPEILIDVHLVNQIATLWKHDKLSIPSYIIYKLRTLYIKIFKKLYLSIYLLLFLKKTSY